MDNLREQITHRFHLELACFQQRRSLLRTKEALRQAEYACREAHVAQTEYDGSFRSLLDRLRGKREEKQEALAREYRQAEETVRSLKSRKESLEQDVQELEEEMQTLPTWETLGEQSRGEEPDFWTEREKLLCTQMLLPLLEETEQALEDYRGILRGERAGEIMSREERWSLSSAHIARAKNCCPLLDRLKKAMGPACPEIGEYFHNPSFFIESAAAHHNRLDRVNTALAQTAKLRKALNGISEK